MFTFSMSVVTAAGCFRRRGALSLLLVVTQLARHCRGDTLDIQADLFRDPNCFERFDTLSLTENGCYANIYGNTSKAFKFEVVSFTSPQNVMFYEYRDACNNLAVPARKIRTAMCAPFTAGLYTMLTTLLRSSTCQGAGCSNLAEGIQSFYTTLDCKGIATQILRVPLQSECLRYYNGTQIFMVDRTSTNITEVDYTLNGACSGPLQSSYNIKNGFCYTLYTAGLTTETDAVRSFQWQVERGGVLFSPGQTTASWATSRYKASMAPLLLLLAGTILVG